MKSQTKIDYLEVWKTIFTNDNIKRECKNVLYFLELLLTTPFTNTKLGNVFSWMNQAKTELCNRLGQERLDTQICIGEEGVNIIEFNPDPHISRKSPESLMHQWSQAYKLFFKVSKCWFFNFTWSNSHGYCTTSTVCVIQVVYKLGLFFHNFVCQWLNQNIFVQLSCK